ncbi:MAG TPA: sigma-70 family RNA polymerase sigma factor [Patescibacteria group bacterium]|nr:sigma-70 family RNA polymerase sigma factor [Patescibacteria group bacterium]
MIDEKSIEEICSSTWEPLYRFIYYKVQNRQEAEDITQETYAKALAHCQKNNIKIDKHIGFLKTVSLNVLRDKWRKSKRQGKVIDIEAINPKEAAVEDSTEACAQKEMLQDALKILKEEHRTVIELRIIKGYSVAETAEIMNKQEGNIRVLQYRALQNLAAILKNND